MAHGFTVQGGFGASGSVIHHESSDHSVLVPDTELLFTAQFHRAGPDLVLTGRDGAHHLVPGYFSSEHHPALVAPNGAHLSPDTVDLLAGSPTPGHYAQAQPTAPPDAIGKIEKVVGDVSVVRNGVTVALHVGDAVFKSDVVQTGASSACGISFPDGTALNLVANTRMALNDYAYDANSNSNGALFSLVEGTFAFVAGKVAHSGDMKIATPVATMGIRGTTGVVQEQPNAPATITANAGDHTYSFAVVPDIGTGITGMWDVYLTDANGIIQRDANGNPIVLVTVSQSGYVTYLTPQGLGQPPLVTTEPATNSQYAFEQQMLSDLFRTLNPSNLNNNGNGGSSTQPPPFNLPNPIPQLFEDSGKPFTINFTNGSNTPIITVNDTVGSSGPLTVVIWIAGGNGPWSSGPSWLGGAPPIVPQEVEILTPVKVTTDGADAAAGLVVATGAILNIVSGTSFTIYDFIHGGGTIAINSSGSDPTLFIHGGVTLVGGGMIKMLGPAGEDNILGVPGTGAALINIDYTIEGTGTIGGGDGNLTFWNYGTVNANDGLLTINTGNQVYNDGLMEATADPVAATNGTLQIKDSVVNAGTVEADGNGAAVSLSGTTLSGTTFDNLFSVVAKNGGSVTFTNVKVTNEAISATDPVGGTINANGGTIAFDGGSIANGHLLEATNGGTLQLENLTVTNSAAGELSIAALSELDLMGASVIGGTDTNAGNVVVTNGASVLHGDSVTNSGTMTVEGADASLTLEGDTTLLNDTGGHITATDGGTVSIEIDADANVNSGTIEAVNGGEVDFYINVEGGSNHGLIEAGAGGTVHFFQVHQGGGSGGGQGGNYGTMEAADGGALIFDGGLDNFDLLEAVNGGLVYLNNGIKNHAGTVDAAGSGSQISISDGNSENLALMLAEHGGVISLASVMMLNDAGATIEAASGGGISWITGGIDNFGTFSAGNNGTITFGGDIGITNESTGIFQAALGGSIVFGASDTGSVSNDGGMIVATTGGTITFDSTLNGAENTGIIKAGTGGTIVIDGFQHGNGLINAANNTIGLIEAQGTGAKVELAGATIVSGKLHSDSGGVFETVSGTSTLIDVIITGGDFKVDTATILDLKADNSGVAAYIDSTVIFEGAGTVQMDSPSTMILAGGSNGTLNNQTTIRGQGTIGSGDSPAAPGFGLLSLINSGTIEAVGGQFTINTGTRNSATTTNSGTLEANGANAVLLIHHTNMNDAGGTIAALNDLDAVAATASVVELLDDVIVGGALKTSNFGTIETITDHGAATTTVFDGLANQGYVLVNDNTTLRLRDTIDNTGGKIALALSGSSDLQIDGTVTLKNGEVELNTSGDKITALATGATLDNTANIHGQGAIGTGDGKLTLDNLSGGVVDADQIGKTLTVHTGNAITNAGTLEATSGATLVIDDDVTNAGGAIATHGSGSAVELDGVTVTSGAMVADTSGTIETGPSGATLHNVDVTDSSAIVVASGTTLTLEDGTTITGGNVGTLTVNYGGGITIGTGGATLDGVDVTLDTGAIVIVSGATLTLDDGTTVKGGGWGTLTIDSGATLAIEASTGATLDGVKVTNDGTIQVDSGVVVTLTLDDDTTISGGLVSIGSVGVLDIEAGAAGSGHGATLDGVTVDNGHQIVVGAGATDTVLTLKGGTTISGGLLSIDGHGTLDIDFPLPPHPHAHGGVGATLDGVTVSNHGTIDIGGVATLVLDDDASITGGDLTLERGPFEVGPVPMLDIEAGAAGSGHGATLDGVTVTNNTVIEVDEKGAGAVLTLKDGTSISGGDLIIEAAGKVDVERGGDGEPPHGATLDGVDVGDQGAIDVGDHGTGAVLTLEDGTKITGGGTGTLTIAANNTLDIKHGGGSGPYFGATLDGVQVADDGAIKVDDTCSGATLTLDDCTTITGGGSGTLTIGAGNTLDIQYGGATLDGVNVTDCGAITIGDTTTGVTLTLDDGTTINGGGFGTLTVATGDTLAIDSGGATLACLTVDNCGGDITIAADTTLTLNHVTVHGGAIDGTDAAVVTSGDVVVASTIDVTGDSTFCHVDVSHGDLTVEKGATLTLDGGTVSDVTLQTDGDGLIEVGSGTSTFSGVTLDDASLKADCGTFLDLENTTTLSGTVTFEGGGTFVLDPGAASIVGGAGGGTLDIAVGATLTGSGDIGNAGATSLTLDNSGTIDADGDGAAIDIETGNTVTNTGLIEATCGGTLEIDDSVNNYGAAPGTIKASGGGSITLLGAEVDSGSTTAGVAGGTIEADACSSIEFDNVTIGLGSSVASGGGTLDAAAGTITVNNGELDVGSATAGGAGTVEATSDGSIALNNVTVDNFGGGTIEATHGGSITVDGGTLYDGSASADVTGGLVEATDCGTITFNGGTVNVGASASGGSGGTMEASHGGAINFEGVTTTNAGGTIEALRDGSIVFDGGTLDDSSATTEVAGGVVEATARCATITFNNVGITLDSAVAGGGGTIKASNGGAITVNGGTINSAISAPISGGTIEALTCGTIRFNSTNIYNQGSSIEADGAGAMIMLAGAMILGGTLETSASGIIETVADTGNATLDGVTIASGSTIQVNDHTTLTLQDTADANATVTNDGTITLVQGCDPSLIVSGDLTLAGSGTVVLSGDTDSIVGAGKGTDTLSSANTIEGAGTIGGEGLIFSNLAGGVVDADVSGHTLVLDTGNTVNNAGTLEATSGGILEIDDNVCNIGGTIAAYGCGSVVELEGVTIKGGMFLTDDSTSGDRGVIEVADTDAATVFDGGSGHTVSIGGFVHVVGGASLELIGTIDLTANGHNGTIDVDLIHVTDSPDIGADLVIHGTVTLTGSGAVVMEGEAAKITGAAPGAALHNAATIVGAGSIGVGNCDLTLVNESCGVINANNASADNLTIDTGGNSIGNHGLLEATGGATLVINSDVDNSCGTIEAVGCDSTVNLDQITVSHGTLETSCNGLIQVVGGDSTFDNLTLASGAHVEVDSGATLTLSHTINSDGTITVDSGATLYLNNLALDGGTIKDDGTVEMTVDSTIGGGAVIDGDIGSLVIDCDHTLTADGATLQNLDITNHGAAIDVDADSTLTLANVTVHGGSIEGADATSGDLASTIDVTGDSTFCNVDLSGGDVTIESNVTLTLNGGSVTDVAITGTDATPCNDGASTIEIAKDITFSDATVSGGTLTVDVDYTLTLDGASINDAIVDISSAPCGKDHASIDVVSDSTISNAQLSGGDNGSNSGNLTVEGGVTLTPPGETIDGVTIDGTDAVTSGDVVAASTIDVTGDTTVTDTSLNDGDLTVEGRVTLTLSGDSLTGVAIENGTPGDGGFSAGTIHVTGNSNFDDVTLNDGNLVVGSGAELTLSGSTISGASIQVYDRNALNQIVTGTIDVIDRSAIDNSSVDGGGGTLTVEDGITLTLDNTSLSNLQVNNGGTLQIDGNDTLTLYATHIDGGEIDDYTDASGSIVVGATIDVSGDSAITNATIDGEGGPATSGMPGVLTVGDDVRLTLDGSTLEDLNVTNNGTLVVEGDTTLTLDDASITGGTIEDYSTNPSGSIVAGNIDITGDTTFGNLTVEKGNLTIDDGTALKVADGTTVTLDGVNVTDNGDLGDASPGSGATLVLEGGTTITGSETGGLTISSGDFLQIEQGCGPDQGATFDALTVENSGTIQIDATLTIADAVSFNDGGTVSMATSGQIVGDGSQASLENVDNTIAGAGSIGGGCLTLSNDADGTILANVSAATLTLDTGDNTISNAGHLEASGNGATLDIRSHVDNTGGTLLAAAGGTVDVESAICGGTATIDHGTLEFGAKSDVDVTFHNSNGYGELILDDAADFSGKIFCFTGTDAGLSNSDEIFLTGVQEGDGGLTANYCSTDNITTVIIDELGGGSITLKFVGNYDADNFKLQQDANGLEIYDPPVGGAKQASSTATTASDGHTSAPVNQVAHVTDHVTSLSNLFGFGGDQDSAAPATSHDSEVAAPADQLALDGKSAIAPLGAPALSGGLAGSLFVDGVADGSGASGATNSDSSQSLLSSLLKTLTGGTDGTPPSIDLGSGHDQAAIAPALVTTAPSNEHVVAPTQVTSLPTASPTIASASFGAMGNDSFAFHASLGGNTAQNTDAHTNEIAHNNVQMGGPALASTAPEFHQEFAFDAIHQDAAALAATVDQFHQMASSSTLLH